MNWSLRLKFLLVMSSLLVVCLGTYLFMAIAVFKTDKTQLVFDLNRSQVANLSSEIETGFEGISEKLKLFALLPIQSQKLLQEELLSEDSPIVSIQMFKTQNQDLVRSITQDKFLQAYGLDEKFFKDVTQEKPIPLDAILKNGVHIWNASLPNHPPLIGFGRLIIAQDSSLKTNEPWAVVGYVTLDRFMGSMSIVTLSETVVVNSLGELLIHPKAELLSQNISFKNNPLFKKALNSSAKLSVLTEVVNGENVLGAYSKSYREQIFVIAQSSEESVFKVVKDFSTGTLLFGSFVLTLVILAAVLLSGSLTQNIAKLTERMEAAARGDLSSELQLKSGDETQILARTFNQMINDLKTSRDDLEIMNRELDQKVKERTHQLEEQNQKVKEVQEALLRTTRLASVGEIAGKTAHEVLNPLTSLLTRVGLLQKRIQGQMLESLRLFKDVSQGWNQDFKSGGFDHLVSSWSKPSSLLAGKKLIDEDLQNLAALDKELGEQFKQLSEDVNFVKDEGERIGKIVNKIRRLGRQNSDLQVTPLHSLLSDCCNIMADLFDQKGFKIEKSFLATTDIVSVDRDEMIQSITNLMRNSFQALEDAARAPGPMGRKLFMAIRTRIEGNSILIEIEDNGHGILPEHQLRLFESSFTTKSPDHGTGLGLGISRRFVRNNGGDIEFAGSKPFRSTLFRIRLPIINVQRSAVGSFS